jgi:hypothetical protein
MCQQVLFNDRYCIKTEIVTAATMKFLSSPMYVRKYLRTYICIYARMHVHMYVCMYVRTYICVYVCMYVSIYVCMDTYSDVHSKQGFTHAVTLRISNAYCSHTQPS